MMGRKLSTVPTPAYTPSITSERTTWLMPQLCKALSLATVNLSMSACSRSCRLPPITSKVSQKMRHMMATNTGKAVQRPVSTLSTSRLRLCSLLSLGFTTVPAHTLLMKS